MGQTLHTPSVDRAWLAAHIGLGLALPSALLILAVLGNASLYAASPPGLVISRSGDHVNVSLDSQAGSDVSIRRSDDVMVIKVPASFDSKLVIDSRLKKDNVVQETEIPSGKIITINSQQIYLMTQENLKAPDVPAASGKPNPADSTGKQVESGNAKGTSSPNRTSRQKPAAPDTATNSMHAAVDTGNTVSTPEASIKPVGLTEKTKLEKPASSLKSPKAATPLPIPSIVPRTAETGSKADSKTSKETSEKAASKTTVSDTSDTAKTSKPDKTPFQQPQAVMDPESQPLDLSGRQQAAATQVASHALFRIVLSLLAVLALLLGFVRVLLPKLMARYPAFFERLRQRHAQPAQPTPQDPPSKSSIHRGLMFNNDAKAQQPEAVETVPQPESRPVGAAQASVTVTAPQPAESSSTALMRQFSDNQMTLLGSTPLGEGKEIHLVEVQGKQLVIATTPSTISFLTDLTDLQTTEDDERPDPGEVNHQESNASQTPPQGQQPNVIAYLSDESPVISEPSQVAKPHASIPNGIQPSAVSPPPAPRVQPPPRREPKEQVYKKYLQPQEPYVDAEEVIVLADYDDVYGF